MDSAQDDVTSAIEQAIVASRPAPQRVVTFGEATVRLTTHDHERLERAHAFEVSVGGPELNTAVGLATFGIPASWVSSLPRSPLGRRVVRAATANGVDIAHVHWVPADEARTGLSFVENAPDPRPTSVEHDVRATAMAKVKPGTFDWVQVLDGATAFHVSGMTLGLSPGVCAEALEGVRVANQMGVLVSFDLQYRPESWSEAEARMAFMRIIHQVDVLFASRGGLRTFYGIEGSYESVLRQAIEKLGVAAVTVSRKRAKGSRRLTLDCMAMGKNGAFAASGTHDVEVADRSGSSDAFAAGFLAEYLDDPQGLTRAVSLGAAACALTYTVPGDFLCATREEIEALAAST